MEISNFLDGDKIRPELLDKDALLIAKDFEKAKLTTNQVRKFYDEVKKYEKLLEKKDFSDVEPLIYMLKSKAKYAVNKKNGMDMVFYEFIDKSIDKIKTATTKESKEQNYKAFCLFFEAIYGFTNFKK